MNTKFPPKDILYPALLEQIRLLCQVLKISENQVEKSAVVSRGTISRIRNGLGCNYATVQAIQSWISQQTANIETGAAVLVVQKVEGEIDGEA